MKKKFALLLTMATLLTGCNNDNGYSECLQYCKEENVVVFYWSINNKDILYNVDAWRFGMCKTSSDTTVPTKDEIDNMYKTTHLTIKELGKLLNETNHADDDKVSIYYAKKGMNEIDYEIWAYNYPMEASWLVTNRMFEEMGIEHD